MNKPLVTWEQAVQWLREQPDSQDTVKACYYDDPLIEAAKRFVASEEWQSTKSYLVGKKPGSVLEIGAGRGIASFAFAQSQWQVTALEPDNSSIVGAGAIINLVQESGLPITVIREFGEKLPFENNSFDLVYGRAVLHHSQNLPQFCREAARVLKPGGLFIAVREHVINNRSKDLEVFFAKHPLHHLYGGENAFTLLEYRQSITGAGFTDLKILKPYSNVINYSVPSQAAQEMRYLASVGRVIGTGLADWLWQRKIMKNAIVKTVSTALDMFSSVPGRLYSFIAIKP